MVQVWSVFVDFIDFKILYFFFCFFLSVTVFMIEQDAKSDRVKQLLKETEKYLQKLGSKLQEAKSMTRHFEVDMDENRTANVVEKNETAVDNEDESDQAKVSLPFVPQFISIFFVTLGSFLYSFLIFYCESACSIIWKAMKSTI